MSTSENIIVRATRAVGKSTSLGMTCRVTGVGARDHTRAELKQLNQKELNRAVNRYPAGFEVVERDAVSIPLSGIWAFREPETQQPSYWLYRGGKITRWTPPLHRKPLRAGG